MDLKLKDVADLLNVSEITIRRWLTDGKIPAYRINHQYRFSRVEIENWVLSHKLMHNDPQLVQQENAVPAEEPEMPAVKRGSKQFSLYRAIHKGGIFSKVPGSNKEEVIRAATKAIVKDLDLDSEVISDLLLDRESLQPTSLNNGVGIPHPRDFLLNTSQDVIAVVFPKKAVGYGALDGKPVHTMFFLFACEDKRHLHLLAKIAHFCSQPEVVEFLQTQPEKNALLSYVKEWESSL